MRLRVGQVRHRDPRAGRKGTGGREGGTTTTTRKEGADKDQTETLRRMADDTLTLGNES